MKTGDGNSIKLILFGAGYWGERALAYFGRENVVCFCDNKINGSDEEELNGLKIISFQRLLEIWKGHMIVICAGSNYTTEICDQLEAAGIEDFFDYTVLSQIIKNIDLFMAKIQTREGCIEVLKQYYKSLANRTKAQYEYLKHLVDITTLKAETGSLRREQMAILDFVEEFLDFIADLNIQPFLVYGNLLGAFRHRGFIPWDDDWDFGLIRKEYNKLLDFARLKCVVGTRCDHIWNDISGQCMEWETVFKRYPNTYIFDIRSDVVQIYKSTYGSIHKPGIDLWIYDFYDESYDMKEHKEWLKKIHHGLRNIRNEMDRVIYLRKELENNSMVRIDNAGNFYPGIDNFEGQPGLKNVNQWIPTKEVFPLQKVLFESREFWAPKNMEILLSFQYPNYMDFPYDLGFPRHEGVSQK